MIVGGIGMRTSRRAGEGEGLCRQLPLTRWHVRYSWVGAALLLAAALVLLPSPPLARAHVTEANMPDAVAETEYMILLEFEPERTEIRNKLAMVLLRKKKYVEAEKELRTVLAAEPANYDALDGLGLVMMQTGRVAEAAVQFQAAIKANPHDVMAHYHLGQAHASLGDQEAACQAYRQALDVAKEPGASPTTAADLDVIRQALAQASALSGSTPAAQ